MVHRHQGAKGQMRHKDHPKLVYPSEYSPDNFWNFGCSYKIPNGILDAVIKSQMQTNFSKTQEWLWKKRKGKL